MSFYEGQRDNVAGSLISSFGLSVIVQEKTGEVFDGVTGAITTPATLVNHATTGVYTKLKRSYWDKTLVHTDDRHLIVSAADFALETPVFVPAVDHQLIIDSEAFSIIQIRPLDPGGVVVLYNMLVRN